MKNIFRRPNATNTNNNGNFVVPTTSFDSNKDDFYGDGTALSGYEEETFQGEEVTTLSNNNEVTGEVKENVSLVDNEALMNIQKLEASRSFVENEEGGEGQPMVEVVQSDNGKSVLIGDDDEEILMEKSAASPAVARRPLWGWMARRNSSGTTNGSGSDDGIPESAPTRRISTRGCWANKARSENDETAPRGGWTRREKMLLWITAFNTILIIILLGNNASLVAQKNQTQRSSFSAATDGCAESSPSDSPPVAWKPAPWNVTGGSGSGGENVPAPVSPPVLAPTGSTPVSSTTGEEPVVGDPNSRCGCSKCTEDIWNTLAGDFTCGERIMYLQTELSKQYPTEVHACRQIAFEFPCICGTCDPGRCKLPTPAFTLPSGWLPPATNSFGNAVTPAPTPFSESPDPNIRDEDQPLYCFPDASARNTYTLWDGMVIQPKASSGACGPGNNFFGSETVVVDTSAQTLTMFYANAVASEVRVLLPEAQRPFSYGTYRFSVKSIEVLNANGGLISNVLPKELVLGLFTWDPYESYAVRENYNHEVDIEISRWNCETNSDMQYLVQPPGLPQMHRFFTGDPDSTSIEAKYQQGGHAYKFDWNPGQIDWTSNTGNDGTNTFVLKTEEAVYRGVPDYVQCLPDRGGHTEVRINLWNSQGPAYPAGLAATDVVKVVIDSFQYIPSGLTHIPTGGICSKHCQCESGIAQCIGNICTAI